MDSPKRPEWVKDVERTPDGTLLVIEGTDGELRGVCMPSRSIRKHHALKDDNA